MISVTTKAFLQENKVLNFKIPENTHLQEGEYEIVIVINTTALKISEKKKLSFSEHDFYFSNPDSTFRREDIYGDFGR